MSYKAYKGRCIVFGTKCKVYRNLHNGLFSVMQGGKVVAHVESFRLSEACFVVNQNGRQRVLNTKQKNVHAFVIGIVQEVNSDYDDVIISNPHTYVYYNPYIYDSFVLGINNLIINKTDKFLNVVGQGKHVVIAHNI